MKDRKWTLPVIVIAQFCCTSLWFAGNGVMNDLVFSFNLEKSALAHLTSAVQFGFISGTLVFAILAIADRFSPSKVFLLSALAGALFNLATIIEDNSLANLLLFRFFTGFFLAGIYPVGMKIAADYYQKGLGKSLGYLVGALVVGTAFPHLLKDYTTEVSWHAVLIITSSLAIFGGLLLVLLVPNGPYRKPTQQLDLTTSLKVFRDRDFRSAAFGYFGHMWELYAFWAFVPLMLSSYNDLHPEFQFDIPLASFLIIGLGGFACVAGGYISQNLGVKRTATLSLLLSGVCCIISPLIFHSAPNYLFVSFLIIWGLAVIADSPLFSTLVAQNVSPEYKGTALTIVNCIGFSITIISIQLVTILRDIVGQENVYVVLSLGPILGLVALRKHRIKKPLNS